MFFSCACSRCFICVANSMQSECRCNKKRKQHTINMGSACKRAHASFRAAGVSSTYTDSAWPARGAEGADGCETGAEAGPAGGSAAAGPMGAPSAGPPASGPLYMNSRRSSLLLGSKCGSRRCHQCAIKAGTKSRGQRTRRGQPPAPREGAPGALAPRLSAFATPRAVSPPPLWLARASTPPLAVSVAH